MKQCLELSQFGLVFEIYKRMRVLGVGHDGYTFPLLNQAVTRVPGGFLYVGMFHCLGIEMGFGFDLYFCNTLMGGYVENGGVEDACKVFDEMPLWDLVSWSVLLRGCVRTGDGVGGFGLFGEMRMMGLEPNAVTMIAMLKVCSCCGSSEIGKGLQGYLVKKGFMNDELVRNSLLKMYADNCDVEGADALYDECERDDVVALNVLLSSYNLIGDTEGVLKRFREMWGEVSPSKETITLVVSSLAKYSAAEQGQQLHCFAVKSGFCDNVLATCLLTLYANCGDWGASVNLFQEIQHKSSITWSSLMSAYIEHGHHVKAVELFNQIQLASKIKPGFDIITTLVDACAELGALHMGKKVHGYRIRNLAYNNAESNSILETSIINMYFKCGDVASARHCFDMMIRRDIIVWTSVIEGYGTHGLGLEAIRLFDQMLEEGIKPNGITFLSLLSACSHSGLMMEGCCLLYSMRPSFHIEPNVLHYTCVVDLLGRSGQLQEALALCFRMVACPDSRTWGSLLSASRIFENRKIGEYAAKKLLELESDNVGYHIVLSNIRASAENWVEVEALRHVVATDVDGNKTPGWSYIEVELGRIEGFVSGDRALLPTDEVYEVLRFLTVQMYML